MIRATRTRKQAGIAERDLVGGLRKLQGMGDISAEI